MTRSQIDRRDFLRAGAAGLAVGYFVNPVAAQQSKSPNERIRIAAVGCTNRAADDINGVASQDIIAIADIDEMLLERGSKPFPNARKYRDYRDMLDKEADHIDAVVVATPDHSHAPAAAQALRMKKHVYCEKPLAHTVHEVRVLRDLAKENNVVTQMGTQIHAGDNYRRVVELVQSGIIGPIHETHVWEQGTWTGAKLQPEPQPANVDWNLWLGPAQERPYCKGIHPYYWRAFWDYGNGRLGDFGCHYIDLVHWALKLEAPTKVTSAGPDVDPVSTPPWLICKYEYPARGDLPAVTLTWYDGGKQPEILASLKNENGERLDWPSGQLFVGREGMIISNYGDHKVLIDKKVADVKRPAQSIPTSIGHHEEWLNAIRNGGPTTCNFDYSGALAESVLLGVVSYKSGESLTWDTKNFKITNLPDQQDLLHKEYRKGWVL